MFKLLIFSSLMCAVFGYYIQKCDRETALLDLKRPTYDFSIDILDTLANGFGNHFVYSPISTWLHLLALADGAQEETRSEILDVLNIAQYEKKKCFRRVLPGIFNSLDEELSPVLIRSNVIAIDRLFEVKDSYVKRVEEFNSMNIVSLNLRNSVESAGIINKLIKKVENGIATNEIVAKDLDLPLMLTNDIAYMKADWKTPFNPAYTKSEPFYTKTTKVEVKMMNQEGFFNLFDIIPEAQALELPFNKRAAMILLLPNEDGEVSELFALLGRINETLLFNANENSKLVNVKMPRFKQTTIISNMPRYMYEMGIQRIFLPYVANFGQITDYSVFVSNMKSAVDIEVTEKGVTASATETVESLIKIDEDPVDFFLNRPFAYLIVDKLAEVILFGGIYSDPSLY